MSSDYWKSQEAEQSVYGIPDGRLWRVYRSIQSGRLDRDPKPSELNEAVSPEELFDRYEIKAVRGSSYWTIKCPHPDHEDRNPSCVVWPSIRGFKCYSCGAKGDLVELYRLFELSRGESLGSS